MVDWIWDNWQAVAFIGYFLCIVVVGWAAWPREKNR